MGPPVGSRLCLVGRGGLCERAPDDVAYWDEWIVPRGALSIPQLVEDQSETLRDEYVAWCSGLGDVYLGGRSLIARLATKLLDGGSFWWTTLIAQHSPMASPVINDVFRLRALEHHYRRGAYVGLDYLGSDKRLAGVLRTWMNALGHPFSWSPPATATSRSRNVRWFDCLPYPLQALLYAGYFLVHRYRHAQSGQRPRVDRDADLVVFSYFPNIDMEKARSGEFRSNYWGPLPGLLRQLGLKVTWIWFYANASQLSYPESVALRRQLNSRNPETRNESFILLEDFMSLRGVFSALVAYGELWFKSLTLGMARRHFRLPGSKIDFFPLMQADWWSSLRGTEAMKHCLYAAAMKDTLTITGAGKKGLLYAWENQGWEQLLLYVAKRLLGAHTLAFVHTNSCTAPLFMRTCLGKSPVETAGSRPVPDCLVVTGDVSRRTLVSWRWPAERISIAEALRYMGLAGKHNMLLRKLPASGRRLLVVTGYMRSETDFQVMLLRDAAASGALSSYSSITIKPHPFCPVDSLLREMSFPIPVNVSSNKLEELFPGADIVYAANSTSAAVEAAWFGLPLVLTAAVDGLNLSPLKGVAGIRFVASADQLAEALKKPVQISLGSGYYNLDPELGSWRSLLGSD